MMLTDIPGVTRSDVAMEGSATLAMEASSTTNTMAPSTEMMPVVRAELLVTFVSFDSMRYRRSRAIG